jgi:type IV pilus assembly protein PilY1
MTYRLLLLMIGLLSCLMGSGSTWADMSQSPLLSQAVNVKPNLALILDTSSSMDYGCVYSPTVNAGILNPSTTEYNLLLTLPKIIRLQAGMVDPCWDATEYATGGINNALQPNRIQMNPLSNYLYYNPRKTYDKGYVAGVQQAVPTSALDATVFWPKSMTDFLAYTTLTQFATTANYNKIVFNSAGFTLNGATVTYNPFGNHGGSRTDCAGDPCTLAEEVNNYAVWNKWHSTRLLAAKTGLTGAFLRQSNNFRLSYITIYDTSLPVMQDFGQATTGTSNLYTWIDGLTTGKSTPLRRVLNIVGKQFQDNKSNTGPWGSNPSNPPANEIATDHLYCRRSFAILTTDGWWNDNESPVGEQDTIKATTLNYNNDSTKNYTYVPGDTGDPRSIGKSDDINGSGGTTNTLADIAMKYWVTDLRDDLPNTASSGKSTDPPFWQNLTTYTVGYGVPGIMTDAQVALAKQGLLNWSSPTANTPSTVDDLRHAAWNGGGDFLNVTDATGFSRDLGNLIGNIAGQQVSQAGVAASAISLVTGTKKFIPTYAANTWWGNVEMVSLDSTGANAGSVWRVISLDKFGKPTSTTTLPTPANRNIHVWVNANQGALPFTHDAINNSSNNLTGSNSNFQLSTNVTKDQVNFLRGDQTKEGGNAGFRIRSATLGDIVNSAPVFIKNNTDPLYQNLPTNTPGYDSYAAYMTSKTNRTEGVLMVGANDGMLHAFAEGTTTTTGGRETFAYVPRSVLGKMESLTQQTYTHKYFVDGPLTETDAYGPSGWTNIVIGTTGAGAKSVFALNVTSPLNMTGNSVMWEINADPDFPSIGKNSSSTFSNLGYVLSPPQSGITVSGDWVTIFGNGYASTNGKATLFIVNTLTGELIKEIATDNNNQNGLGGVRLVLNANQQIIGAYAGDLMGKVWKFDLSSQSSSDWKLGNAGRALFQALGGSPQNVPIPITAAPAVLQRNDQANYNPSYLVTVGTGKLFETTDSTAPSITQMVYGLWDLEPFGLKDPNQLGTNTISDSSLVSLMLNDLTSTVSTNTGQTLNNTSPTKFYGVKFTNSSTIAMDWSSKRGWKLPLDVATGMRVVYPTQMLNDVVKVDTVAPQNNTDKCVATNATAVSIYIDPLKASCNSSGTFDINGDGTINFSDKTVCAYSSLADGQDVALRILDSKGGDSGLRDIQNSSGHITVNTKRTSNDCSDSDYYNKNLSACQCGDSKYALAHVDQCKPDCTMDFYRSAKPGACPGSIKSRSWRQIFPR